jgi:Choline-glycine betaine transporter
MKKLLGDVDLTIFGGAAAIYTALFIFIISVPQIAEKVISSSLNFALNQLGWIYLLSFSLIFIFLMILAFSKFGKIKLGQPDDQPEYSFFGWASMLFIAGLGVGLVFFGVYEPISHYYHSPFAPDQTPEAATVAMRTTFFHWGFHPWAMYTAAGLAMAYFQHRRGLPGRVSSAFEPMLGREGLNGLTAKIIDIFSMVAILCGVATSVGFAGNQFAAGLVSEYGFEKSDVLVAGAIILICGLATASALKGVAKGIKLLSDFNLYIVLGLIAFMIIAGPTMYQFNIFFESFGEYINDFPRLSFFLDANGAVAG